MKPTRTLDEIYKDIPHIACKGLCHATCVSKVPMSRRERRRVERVIGRPVPCVPLTPWRLRGVTLSDASDCAALVDGRCSAYSVRPAMCRLWGVTEKMRCPFGCIPDGGFISDEAVLAIIQKVTALG